MTLVYKQQAENLNGELVNGLLLKLNYLNAKLFPFMNLISIGIEYISVCRLAFVKKRLMVSYHLSFQKSPDAMNLTNYFISFIFVSRY